MANFQLQDAQKVSYAVAVTDVDNNPTTLQPGDVVTAISSMPASLAVVPDATPVAGSVASGFLVASSTLALGVTFTVTITPAATGAAAIVATDLIGVVAGADTGVTITLGTPVSQ